MAAKSLAGGELYFIGEKDPVTREDTSFVKIGIVRDNDARGTDHRVKEHQTGNPRLLHVVRVLKTPVVERVETTLHGLFAPSRLSGEWFSFKSMARSQAIEAAAQLVKDARKSEQAMNEAEQLKQVVSKSQLLEPTGQHRKLHKTIVELRAQIKACNELSKAITETLESLLRSGVDCGHMVSLQERRASERFDEAAFKAMYPKIWAKYQIMTDSFSGSFRVTDPRAQKPDPFMLNEELADLATRVQSQIKTTLKKSSGIDKLHHHYLNLLAFQAPLDWQLMLVEDAVKTAIGQSSGIDGLFVWKREKTKKEVLDKAALKELEPKKYGSFVSEVKSKPAVIVAKDQGFFL